MMIKNKFIVECVNIIWCILYYKFAIYAIAFTIENVRYNPNIHRIVNDGGTVELCVFPSLQKDDMALIFIYFVVQNNA